MSSVGRCAAVIDAAFAGKPAEVESHFAKAPGEGTAPGAVEGARPPIYFRRKPAIDMALRAWTTAKLADALLQTRRQPNLAEAIAQRALMTLAAAARKKP